MSDAKPPVIGHGRGAPGLPVPDTLQVDAGSLKRCARRVRKGEHLLRWVKDECDLSGQMELDQAITAYLEEI